MGVVEGKGRRKGKGREIKESRGKEGNTRTREVGEYKEEDEGEDLGL